MSELKLVEQQTKPIHWKKERVNYFADKFQQTQERRCPLGYPMMMKLLSVYAEEKWSYTDDETGEIIFEIPPMDEWKAQVDGFFRDEFAAKNCGYHFSYLLKQYGRFVKYEVKQETPKTHYKCDYCGQNVRLANKQGHKYSCPNYPKNLF